MCKCDCISIQIHLNQCGCAYRAAEVNARGRARSRRTASIPQTLPACDGASRSAFSLSGCIRPHDANIASARPGQSCGQRIAAVAAAWLVCRNCRGQIPAGPADSLDVFGIAVFCGSPRPRLIRLPTIVVPIPLVDTEPTRASGLPATGVHPSAGVAWASIVRPRRYPAIRFAQPRQPSPDSTWPPACHGCRRWRYGWSAGDYPWPRQFPHTTSPRQTA